MGKRVRLRAIEREDIPTFVRWFNDPEVRQYIQMYEPLSRAMEERWFEERLSRKGDFIFCVEAQQGDTWVSIGNVGLHGVDWKNRSAVFGIVLGEKSFWGKGFGSDAARAMLHFAFRELNLHRVELDVYAFNPRAMRCYEKVGFRREGTRRDAHFHDGSFHDVHVMGVLQDEFCDA
jgi:RimJ/RimL family protein N-acetyltransferase